MVFPTERVYVNASFGVRGPWAAGYHPGIDYDATVGTPIYSTKRGTVRYVGTYGGWGQDYGLHIIIRSWHVYRFIDHLYAHCSSSYVRTGQKVNTKQLIGRSGDTGRITGPHLHYEERHFPYGYYNHHNPVLPYWDPPPPKPSISLRKVRPGKKNRHVLRLKRRMNKYFPKMKPLRGFTFTEEMQQRYKQIQENFGYSGKNANGIPGRETLEKLGFRVKK
jgi:hypothetical protein